MKPTDTKDRYWLYSQDYNRGYPKHTEFGGKWLVFIHRDRIDSVWEDIKRILLEGKLGNVAKVSTSKSNIHSVNSDEHVICVYTYDSRNLKDLSRIRQSLRDIGIIQKIYYKTDLATIQNKYGKDSYLYCE